MSDVVVVTVVSKNVEGIIVVIPSVVKVVVVVVVFVVVGEDVEATVAVTIDVRVVVDQRVWVSIVEDALEQSQDEPSSSTNSPSTQLKLALPTHPVLCASARTESPFCQGPL